MVQFIDKDALVAEIENWKQHTSKCGYAGQGEYEEGNKQGRLDTCEKILSFLDTFEDNIQELLDSGRRPEEVFDYVGCFIDGLVPVEINKKWNYIDENNKLLFPDTWFDKCLDFNEGFARVLLNGKWYFIDKNGKHYDENKKPLNESVNMEKEAKETIFDNKVFKDLLDYLTNATPEQLEEDWKQIEKLNEYGPLMGDLIKEALEKK